MPFSIRSGTKEDIDELANIYVNIYIQTNPIEKWTLDSANEFISYFHNASKGLFFVGVYDNEIIGAIWGQIKPWWSGNKLYDLEIFIKEIYRKTC